MSLHCAGPENIPTPPQKGLEFPGEGGSVRSKNVKKCMKLNRNFQRGGGDLEKFPSVGEVWIFSGTTHCNKQYFVINYPTVYLKDFKSCNVENANEWSTFTLCSIKRLVDSWHDPFEHSLIKRLWDSLNGKLCLWNERSFDQTEIKHTLKLTNLSLDTAL